MRKLYALFMRGIGRGPGVAMGAMAALLIAAGIAAAATIDLGTAGPFHYIFASRQFDPGNATSVTAKCSSGEHILGAGFGIGDPEAPADYPVNDSAPADGPDGDSKPNDAWTVAGIPIVLKSLRVQHHLR